jgi:hypothetical protein
MPQPVFLNTTTLSTSSEAGDFEAKPVSLAKYVEAKSFEAKLVSLRRSR